MHSRAEQYSHKEGGKLPFKYRYISSLSVLRNAVHTMLSGANKRHRSRLTCGSIYGLRSCSVDGCGYLRESTAGSLKLISGPISNVPASPYLDYRDISDRGVPIIVQCCHILRNWKSDQ